VIDYFVIADEDTVNGFRYAGVEGRVVNTPEEALEALTERVESGGGGIVIITDEIARTIEDEVNELRFGSSGPLIVQIPGPSGPAENRPDLAGMIREAMGVRL
jgi:V/A-type H+/Na+-transporting ATPase subunit F